MPQLKTPPVTDDEIRAMFQDPRYRERSVTSGDVAVWVYRHRGGWGNSDGRRYPGQDESAVAPVRGTHATVALDRLVEAGLVVKAHGYLAAREMAALSLGTVARDRANYYAWAEQVRALGAARAEQAREQARMAGRVAEAQQVLGDRVSKVCVRDGRYVVVLDEDQLDGLLARTEHLALLAGGPQD